MSREKQRLELCLADAADVVIDIENAQGVNLPPATRRSEAGMRLQHVKKALVSLEACTLNLKMVAKQLELDSKR